MILRDLSRRERNAFERALVDDHLTFRLHITVRDQNEKALGSLTAETDEEEWRFRNLPGVIDGQIDVDGEADVTHQLTLELADPNGKLVFDKNHPGQSGLFPDRFLSVEHSIWVESPIIHDWVDVPTFWGPIMRFSRNASTVSLEAQGKEALYLAPYFAWKPITIERAYNAVEAIELILRRHGERRFDLPDTNRKTSKDFSLGRHTEPWRICKKIANSIDRQLFFDGRGRCRMRRWPENPTITLFDGWRREDED